MTQAFFKKLPLWCAIVIISSIPAFIIAHEESEAFLGRIIGIVVFIVLYTVCATWKGDRWHSFSQAYVGALGIRTLMVLALITSAFPRLSNIADNPLAIPDFIAGILSVLAINFLSTFGSSFNESLIGQFLLTMLTGGILSIMVLILALVLWPLITLFKKLFLKPGPTL